MSRDRIESQLAEVVAKIESLPPNLRGPLLDLVDEARERMREVSVAADRARDAVDDWRLALKYRVFDAEATAREAALRRRHRGET